MIRGSFAIFLCALYIIRIPWNFIHCVSNIIRGSSNVHCITNTQDHYTRCFPAYSYSVSQYFWSAGLFILTLLCTSCSPIHNKRGGTRSNVTRARAEDGSMEQILQSLNLGTLYARFQEQRIEPETLLAASDQELVRLGISTIGDRIRIRDACKKKLEENDTATSQATAVREERRSLFNPRRYNNRTQVRSAARSSSGASKGKSRVYPSFHGRPNLFVWRIALHLKHQRLWSNKFYSKLALG